MILLTGGSGTLGKELIKQAPNQIIAPSHSELDIMNINSCCTFLKKYELDYIIHAAALTGLERCQKRKDDAYEINVWGTVNICRAANAFDVPVYYISTDYVFDGSKRDWKETDCPNPLSVYAKTKALGEAAVLMINGSIFRTSFCKKVWPYATAYDNKFSSFDTVDIIANYILKCADIIFNMRSSAYDEYKIIHIGTERKTFYDLAVKLNPHVKAKGLCDPENLVPYDTSLDTTSMKKLLGIN